MSTPSSTPLLLRRVAARAGLGVWRHRGAMLMGAVVVLGIAGYLAVSPAPGSHLPPNLESIIGSSDGSFAATANDCADTAIAAIANKSSAVAQRAYQCMDPIFQQRVTEQVFVQQMQAQALTNIKSLSRIGVYHTPSGGTMVYYAVDTNAQSVGYIVYLGQDGKVQKIE